MHPTISYHLATARAAELRSQAQRDALARAARHARTHKLEHAAPRLAAAGRRLLTSLRPAAPDQPPASLPAGIPAVARVQVDARRRQQSQLVVQAQRLR